ncbi:MAG: ATP-binding cassette domain-containing protein, partial [Roseobacter sp.]|nr:ATP-binding cassette domain-containing protein [Roseobacter sp.]
MTSNPKIQLRGVYKVFGPRDKDMMVHVRAGVNKDALLADHGHVLGLQNIDIDMQTGEITVVMGLSGSGKSTLIRHLNRLIDPTAGTILVDGQDVTKLSETQLRHLRQQKMAMVFQKFALLPHRTVLQNAATALAVQGADRAKQDREARRWLERVGLNGYEDRYPSQLSGGMQQRVGIARALTAGTDIMLLDEA